MTKVVNRSPRWAYQVTGDLLAELDRAATALGLDRPDTAKQAMQAGLAILLADVPTKETVSRMKADEVRYPEGWSGKMLTANIDPLGIEIVDGTFEQPVSAEAPPEGPGAAPTSPAEELSSSAAPSAPWEPDVETVARLLRERGFTEARAEDDGTGKLTLLGVIPDNPFDTDPRSEEFWAAAAKIRNELAHGVANCAGS